MLAACAGAHPGPRHDMRVASGGAPSGERAEGCSGRSEEGRRRLGAPEAGIGPPLGHRLHLRVQRISIGEGVSVGVHGVLEEAAAETTAGVPTSKSRH